ncbi:holo-ACP synthase [Nocardioides sp.]|uniref:holo-ACP synthase n=1 Tax=Nocardioides sp. TaxID=35761 RepID=UPI00356A35DB
MSSLTTEVGLPRARTGCDVQRVDVVTEAIGDFGARYLDRVYTRAEQDGCRLGGPASLAARFAAKEAVLKLIGTADGVDLREVEILTPTGRPEVRLRGRAAELAADLGLRAEDIDVSLSHSGDLALAVAAAVISRLPDAAAPADRHARSTSHPHSPKESGVHD